MTTKQEIIDYIRNLDLPHGMVLSQKKLIQMIKDIKPKVKKLEFEFIDGKNQYWNQWYAESRFGGYRIDNLNPFSVYSDFGFSKKFKSLEQAQEACQKHYEESILGALEDN